MLAARAARTAARNRGLTLGSGRPERAAVVSARMILVKILPRFLSCAPFRYMMFLNCEWPAIFAVSWSRMIELTGRARHGHQPDVITGGLTSQYGIIAARPRLSKALSF